VVRTRAEVVRTQAEMRVN